MTLKHIGAAAAIVGALLAGSVGPSVAGPWKPGARPDLPDVLIDEVRRIVDNEALRVAIGVQNGKFADLDQAGIDKLDQQWRTEREERLKPLIAEVLSRPASGYLTQVKADSRGLILEIFVTDNKGLNVAQSDITSDYWQGDEEKFQGSFGQGKDGVVIGEVEVHDRFKVPMAQLSVTVTDQIGIPIGSVTIDIDLSELDERLEKGLLAGS